MREACPKQIVSGLPNRLDNLGSGARPLNPELGGFHLGPRIFDVASRAARYSISRPDVITIRGFENAWACLRTGASSHQSLISENAKRGRKRDRIWAFGQWPFSFNASEEFAGGQGGDLVSQQLANVGRLAEYLP